MPNITVVRAHLFEAVGRTYTDAEFDELCFEFGVEVDDVCEEVIEYTGNGTKETHIVYIIAIPANRYDLLCLEGFARALRIFIGVDKSPNYTKVEPASRAICYVEHETSQIRPFIVCAILRNVTFDHKRYKSFIDLQDKLHQNICRKRSYVAIGTHDLDSVNGPFYYKALPPSAINFVPLTEDNGKSYEAKELLTFYREDPSCKHLKPYTDYIYDSPVYPVVMDKDNVVLSLPPIINSKHSRIKMSTKNIFIECTATDITKANIVLDTMVTMFSEYCAEPFTVEPVDIIYNHDNRKETTPVLYTRSCDAIVDDINGTIGVNLSSETIISLCNRMQLGPAVYDSSSNKITVNVPPTRSDILHAVDVIEDVAIAYGYNKIVQVIPNTNTVGAPLPINQFTDLLRAEIARAGYVEMLTHGLCSTAENFTNLRRPIGPAVSLSNPANIEYEVVRTTLIPGALKTLAHNKSISHKVGVKLFEISDIVNAVPTSDIGAVNHRNLVAVYSAQSSGFEVIHGLVDRIMTCVQIRPEDVYALNSLTAEEIADGKRVARSGICYYVRPGNDPVFFDGMGAEVVLKKTDDANNVTESVVGIIGVVHPEVLKSFDISYPCSITELDLEALM